MDRSTRNELRSDARTQRKIVGAGVVVASAVTGLMGVGAGRLLGVVLTDAPRAAGRVQFVATVILVFLGGYGLERITARLRHRLERRDAP